MSPIWVATRSASSPSPHAVEPVVDGDAAEEAHGVLIDRRQRGVFQRGEHRGVMRMDMHQAARLRHLAVDRAVQAPGGRIGRVGAVHGFGIIGIDQQQFAGADAGEMPAVRVHQEPRAVVGHRVAEVVGDALVHVQPAPSSGRHRRDRRGPPRSRDWREVFLPIRRRSWRSPCSAPGPDTAPHRDAMPRCRSPQCAAQGGGGCASLRPCWLFSQTAPIAIFSPPR